MSNEDAASASSEKWRAPPVGYEPQDPARYDPAIGLIGCGGITVEHLTAYRAAGYRVVALCDVNWEAARKRQQEFYPDANIYEDPQDVLERDDVEVVDIATHPDVRPELVAAALSAGKHVLSQKPFVLDLDVGRQLADLAERQGVALAVNQNGRWAPHFSYVRRLVAEGWLGKILAVHTGVHWDHSWVAGTEFEKVKHLILFDFAIHWFDMLTCLMGDEVPRGVYATTSRSPQQKIAPHLLAQAQVEYDEAQASLVFDGSVTNGGHDSTFVAGTLGTFRSLGADLNQQTATVTIGENSASPQLKGRWFPDGFHGTMGELLCAIEQGREPSHNARNNLRSLELCFAAVASAESGQPVVPGTVSRMPTT
ncbi:MAG: gfo/Idh/MocA family oxidoreductase [Planctomycetota bacterium]|nr:MAG: gfo/Idh/MocA family oxidoreductase [Planctomycetota bacterium]REJ88024.1 MAG: gfo/Idh/MocA family oxidoreductase [Planctomycetota bacterium]